MEEETLSILRRRDGWDEAVGRLRHRLDQWGARAEADATAFIRKYEGERPAMVVDVVTSRQRSYDARVRPMVDAFAASDAASSLECLAERGSGLSGLRAGEDDTIRHVAAGLLAFGTDSGGVLSDDGLCAGWASASAGLELAHTLDPYVGRVSGIGPALFCYLRMRCGGDALKPDVRVRKALRALGFNPPSGDAALIVLGSALAVEVGIPRLVLDQLLWVEPPARVPL